MNSFVLTTDEFFRWYQPQQNPFDDNASYDGCMFETYGKEHDHIKLVNDFAPDRIWTMLDCEGKTIVANGYHFVNRIGYIITELPAPEGMYFEVLDENDFDYQSII